MRPRVILHTTRSSGVRVTTPAPEIMAALTQGGRPLSDYGTSYDEQIARQPTWGPYLRALERGGCTDAEAYDLILNKDVPEDERRSAEVVEVSELPPSRWWRDAWRRSPNGGPIWIDMELARPVHLRWVGNRLGRANLGWWIRRDAPLAVDWPAIRRQVGLARYLEELRQIWPPELRMAAA